MGKKSRLKKQIRQGGIVKDLVDKKSNESSPFDGAAKSAWENVWLGLIYFGTALSLFSPFILSGKFYFPFVGPKGLFIMACSELVFFSWLILLLTVGKKYRPCLNSILIAFALFILMLILSTIFGDDPSRSFWSKFERMTGLLMWLHLFGLFLALSGCLKTLKSWKWLFILSISIGVIISLMALAEKAGVKAFDFSGRGGSTLGNSSFLGTYLLFNIFLAVYLFFNTVKWQRFIWLVPIALALAAIYFSHARAASLASFGGLLLLAMALWSFRVSNARLKWVGRIILALGCLVVLAAVIMLFIPRTSVSDKFISLATKSRPVNWAMAWKGFFEKPFFGWGLENYYLLFPKYFNPCLFTPDCGGEVWFDRTHNIVLDTLVANGIFGLLAYLAVFGCLILALYRSRKKDFWAFAAMTSLLVAYFVQNLSVFDMPVSLLYFALILSFVSFVFGHSTRLTQLKNPPPLSSPFFANWRKRGRSVEEVKGFNYLSRDSIQVQEDGLTTITKHRWPAVIVVVAFLLCFSYCVVQPARTGNFVLKALNAREVPQRLAYAKQALDVSDLGRYQIRDFFAEQFSMDVQRNFKEFVASEETKRMAEDIFNFLITQLEKSKKESPLDYSATLRLAQVYNLYSYFDFSKAPLAEKYSQEAVALSPTNPQSYWILSQAQLYMGKPKEAMASAEKAVALEPKWFGSWKIAIQVAERIGDKEKIQELSQRALDLALSVIEQRPDDLIYYQYATEFASNLGKTEQAKEIAQRAVSHNPQWQSEFNDLLSQANSATSTTSTLDK